NDARREAGHRIDGAAAPLFHVLGEERRGPGPGETRRLLAERGALVAGEPMRRVGIGVGFGLRLLLLDLVDRGHRDAIVLLAEVHLQWALGLLVGELADHAAV